MSARSTGFVRDARFGPGQVIPGTNRATTKKWRALGAPDVAAGLVHAGACEQCGAVCCLCGQCVAHRKAKVCPDCAGIPGERSAR